MKTRFSGNLRGVVAATAVAVAAFAAPAAQAAGITGSLGVVSKYVLRGITNDAESDDAAIQAGLNYNFDSGLYLGYWGSSLDYASVPPATPTTRGVENNLIAGYSMSLGNEMTLDFGGVYYYYIDVEDSDAFEPYVNFTTGPFTAGAKYLTKDVLWGNSGDIYLTGAYTTKLPADFTLKGLVGFYVYDKDGRFNPQTSASESSGFRHLDLTLSHPLGKSGLDMSVTYIVGGENRYGVDQEDTVVLGLSGSF